MWLDTGLAVLELNQGLNFILNQLWKNTNVSLINRILTPSSREHKRSNAALPVFGTGIVLVERVFALGIASQPAETDATIDPVSEKKAT